MVEWMRNTLEREDGQAMAEYGIILALIAIVVVAALAALGGHLAHILQSVASGL